jgi:glycosyltransferase involved in cell wall biosynthesis
MEQLPKLLVLGSSLPGSRDGGGVVRDEILKRYPRDQYVCFSVNPLGSLAKTRELPESLRNVPCLIAPLAPHPRLRGARFYMPLVRALGFYLAAPYRIQQAVSFGRRHGVEMVWAEFQVDVLVIAQKVAAGLGVPLVGTVWDDPEAWLEVYDKFSRRLLQRRFREALQGARHLSTAGEAMQKAYEKEYGVKSVILRHGFETPVFPGEHCRDHNEIVIGFVGSPYGRDAWTAFLSAVAHLNSSGRLPQIRLRVFGGGEFPYRRDGVQIDFRGWQPQDVLLSEIAQTDFCYLQYWFEPHKRQHAALSFPNKFETYLAAGRPVLFHGPAYAGIARTIVQYGVGPSVHSLDEAEIGAALKQLILDAPLREKFSRASLAAFESEFNADKMMSNFAALIGVDPELLLRK